MKSNDWKEVKLGEVCCFQKGYAFKSKDYTETGRKIVKVSNLTDYDIKLEECVCINKAESKLYERYELQENDIVITTVGSWASNPNSVVGKVIKVQKEASHCLLNQNAVRLRHNKFANQKYIFYALKDKNFLNYIIGTAQGAANQASITQDSIKNYIIYIPSISEQKAIADTLSCIDDKIELNNKINKNLEAQAQAIFKSWFVDFEPFQDGEFVDSELGKIPKGWRVGTLGDYVKVKSGFAFKSAWWRESGIPVIKIKNIGNNTLDLNDVSYVSKEKKEIAKDFIASAGDLLIAMTGATIGKFAIVPMCKNVLLVNQRVGKFFLCDNPIEKLPFIYNILGLDYVQEAIVTRGSGSAQPNISPTSIETIPIILPPADIIGKFNNLLKSFYKKIIYIEQETQTLTTLRDTLLPKLMSGEIRVPVEVE